ncbi:MAG: peptide ABC transporter substrate-binding protein [Pseudomonadota bacterium]
MTESATRRRPASAKLTVVFLLVFAALSALQGCEQPDTAAEPTTLHRGVGSDPDSLDAHKAQSVQAFAVLRDLSEGLMAYDRHGGLVPGVAESHSVSEDGLRYTFKLREDARWSNGDPVTADDFVYGLRRLVDPATAALRVKAIAAVVNANEIVAGDSAPETLGVTALDPLTLEIVLEHPTPYFLELLTHPTTHPVHAASVAAHGAAFARPGNLVTNGAYRLLNLTPGSLVELERNPYYWNDANTAIDRVHYHALPQPMSEYNRFRAGELHVTSNVPPDIFEDVQASFPAELRIALTFTTYYYGYNVTRPPFKDSPELRRALSMAIDRDVLVKKITRRGERPAYSWVPPGITGYEPAELYFKGLDREERNEQARQLYAAAGYSAENPAEIELRYNTSDTHRRIALAVQSMWRDVFGFEAKLINEEFAVLIANMQAREITEVFRSSWGGEYIDAHSFLSVFESDNPSNLAGWSSAEYDGLMRRAAAEQNPEKRNRHLEEAERLLLTEQPLIPLYYYVSKHLVSEDIEGWADNVLDFHYSHHLSFADAADGD